ncbi:MAG: hypothetical protein AAFO75_14540, partial [Pseudomonadota bacterium]
LDDDKINAVLCVVSARTSAYSSGDSSFMRVGSRRQSSDFTRLVLLTHPFDIPTSPGNEQFYRIFFTTDYSVFQ